MRERYRIPQPPERPQREAARPATPDINTPAFGAPVVIPTPTMVGPAPIPAPAVAKPSPIPARPTPVIRKPAAPAPEPLRAAPPIKDDDAKAVEIKISLPTLPKLPNLSSLRKSRPAAMTDRATRRAGRRPSRRMTIAASAAAAVVIVGAAAVLLLMPDKSDSPQAAATTSEAAAQGKVAGATALAKGTPDYKTMSPAGKSIESLGGWTRVSPPDTNPVYAYTDVIGGVSVAVSQQPLPEEFERDTEDAIADLAKGYSATDRLTAGRTTVHIGTSTKGPQSVIFTKNDLLVLIKSDAPIQAEAWTAYINALR